MSVGGLRVTFAAWGLALVLLGDLAVGICDTCGGGGDAVFKWLAIASGLVAIALAVFVHSIPRGVGWPLFALQFVLALLAYKSVGAGGGAVRISGDIAVLALALEAVGASAVAVRQGRGTDVTGG
jgi:hypothetical protein